MASAFYSHRKGEYVYDVTVTKDETVRLSHRYRARLTNAERIEDGRLAPVPRARASARILARGGHEEYPQTLVSSAKYGGHSSVLPRPWVLLYQAAPRSRTSLITVSVATPVIRLALRA